MAKSIRAKDQKRYRAALRKEVLEPQLKKRLRKTSRGMLETLMKSNPGVPVEELQKKLGIEVEFQNSNGKLSTVHKKKLPFTFNPKLRAVRLANDLEDETDDEAVAAAEAENAEEEVLEFGYNPEVEESGVHKSATKPKGKREITTEYRHWMNVDLINKDCAGVYDVVGGKSDSRKRWAERKKRNNKRKSGNNKDVEMN